MGCRRNIRHALIRSLGPFSNFPLELSTDPSAHKLIPLYIIVQCFHALLLHESLRLISESVASWPCSTVPSSPVIIAAGRTDSLDGRNSHSCADTSLPYLSFASCTLCIISRSFSPPRNAYYPGRLSGRLPSRFQIISKLFGLFPPCSPFFSSPLPSRSTPVRHARNLTKAEKRVAVFFIARYEAKRVTVNFYSTRPRCCSQRRWKLLRVSNHNRMRDVTRD